MSGINLSRLISRPHHRNNQFLLEIIIMVLMVNVVSISVMNGRLIMGIKI